MANGNLPEVAFRKSNYTVPQGMAALLAAFIARFLTVAKIEFLLSQPVKGTASRHGKVHAVAFEHTARTITLRAQPSDNKTCFELRFFVPAGENVETLFGRMKAEESPNSSDDDAPPADEATLRDHLAEVMKQLAAQRLEEERFQRAAEESQRLRELARSEIRRLDAIDQSTAGHRAETQEAIEGLVVEECEIKAKLAAIEEGKRRFEALAVLALEQGIDLDDPAALARLKAAVAAKKKKS